MENDKAREAFAFAVEATLQHVFNDFCTDTGNAPDCFTWSSRRLTADFSIGNFSSSVADILYDQALATLAKSGER